jgi:tRNA threonylcarbamoyladenosine biosynthesis protein TsaB
MSKVLALDTSTDACSVALLNGEQRICRFEVVPRGHTKLLLPMVESVLKEAKLSVAELDAIAFGRGPGSFAGIRIATGATQGLAVAFDTPVVPLSTLETLAYQALQLCPDTGFILSTLDARMDEVYWAVFKVENGTIFAVTGEQVTAPSAVVLPEEASPCVAIGPGLNYIEQMSDSTQNAFSQVLSDEYPNAESMLNRAMIALDRGDKVLPEEALPVYVREGTWKKRSEQ